MPESNQRRDAISKINRKLPIHVYQIIILVVGVVIAFGFAFYVTSLYKSSQAASSGIISPCVRFTNETKVCQVASTTVLKSYPGEVLNVNKGGGGWIFTVYLSKAVTSRDGTPVKQIDVKTSADGSKIEAIKI
ncbi:MAG: hypothetical protein HYW23_01810 [Candidatus Aenigmarchaeota archaeon]|nr:hypothetical protein [Candidatus Aenigmarchaeota archaeon]